jgi:integrase
MGSVYRRDDSDVWWISYSIAGRRFRESTGTNRKEAAKALLGKRESTVFEGTHFPERRKAGLTITALKELWEKHAANKKSLASDKNRFKAIVEFFGGSMQIAALMPSDVEAFKAHLQEKKTRRKAKPRPASVNRHLELLRAALRVAEADGHLHRNPMRGVKFLAEHNERDRVATNDEYQALIGKAVPSLRLAIIIANYTGMRLGEIASLAWPQINLKSREVKLRSSDTKTGRARTVPLAEQVVTELKKLPRRLDGRVFTVKASSLASMFTRLCRGLGIKDLHFHDLRHTAATRWRRSGADVMAIAKLTGHADLSMVRRYLTIDVEDLHAVIDKTKA